LASVMHGYFPVDSMNSILILPRFTSSSVNQATHELEYVAWLR
jgi:hypothetical protein